MSTIHTYPHIPTGPAVFKRTPMIAPYLCEPCGEQGERRRRMTTSTRLGETPLRSLSYRSRIKPRSLVPVPFNPPFPSPISPTVLDARPSFPQRIPKSAAAPEGAPITFTDSATAADGGWQSRPKLNVNHRRPPALTPRRTHPSNTLHLPTRRNHHRHNPLTEQYRLATVVRAPMVNIQRHHRRR